MDPDNITALVQANGWNRRHASTREDIEALKKAFGIELPADFENLLRFSNGGSIYGFKTPFILFSIREILALYREFDYYGEVPGFMIWGADGGGIQYAYDLRDSAFTVYAFYYDDAGYDKFFYKADSITSM